jgi:hypothetical protein
MGLIFTAKDKELLEMIFNYGGYIKANILPYFYKDLSIRTCQNKLKRLSDLGYLKVKHFSNDRLTSLKREGFLYQVTNKTCKHFNNNNSYFRKPHKSEYINRALLKSKFLFENANEFKNYYITDFFKKTEIFLKNNFNPELLPRKYNSGDSFVHIEETLINIDNIEFLNFKNSICICYFDKYYIDTNKQIYNIMNKYINLKGDRNLSILIITDNENRYESYKYGIKNLKIKRLKTYNKTLLLYYKEHMKAFSKFKDYSKENIEEEYKKNKLKKIISKKTADFDLKSMDVEGYKSRLNSIDKIKSEIKSIMINSSISTEDKFNKIDNLLLELIYLDYENRIFLDDNDKHDINIDSYLISDI